MRGVVLSRSDLLDRQKPTKEFADADTVFGGNKPVLEALNLHLCTRAPLLLWDISNEEGGTKKNDGDDCNNPCSTHRSLL